MSFTVIDFIVDLMSGGSEVYLARKRDKKNEKNEGQEEAVAPVNRQDGDPTDDEKRGLTENWPIVTRLPESSAIRLLRQARKPR